jgi:SAM-dependent methyltransferase
VSSRPQEAGVRSEGGSPPGAPAGAFDFGGLAALSDLSTPEWRELFAGFERDQEKFLSREVAFRSPEYAYPRDPLHNWSRAWEYPYVFHHLEGVAGTGGRPASVVDLGSGVTFFPFSVARLGHSVTCVDIDEVCERDMLRAAEAVAHGPGAVAFRRCTRTSLPFENGEADAVCCISVLEHTGEVEAVLDEVRRILRPGGLFLLTVDIDLLGGRELGVESHRALTDALAARFEPAYPERTVHPLNVLTSDRGPYAVRAPRGLARCRFVIREFLRGVLGRPRRALLPFRLAVQGTVLRRPAAPGGGAAANGGAT